MLVSGELSLHTVCCPFTVCCVKLKLFVESLEMQYLYIITTLSSLFVQTCPELFVHIGQGFIHTRKELQSSDCVLFMLSISWDLIR